jgi:hypothetical protein
VSVSRASSQGHPVLGGADDLDQLVLGHRVAGLAAEDVVQPRLGAALVAQPQEVLQGIDDAPAGEEVDRDVELVLGGHVRRVAVPLQDPLVDGVHLLDEGAFILSPAVVTGSPTGLPNWVMITCSTSLTV